MSGSEHVIQPGHSHHDVFISYAQADKPVADAVCVKLESRHIRCWIAPRDVAPGQNFPEAIMEGIEGCRIVLVIFSSHSNNSPHVLRELTTAVNKGRIIVPFRIEDVPLSKSMEYLMSVPHWMDAITPPIEKHIDLLATTVEHILLPADEPVVCASCKTPLSYNARFCEKCGTPVPAGSPSVPPLAAELLPAPPDVPQNPPAGPNPPSAESLSYLFQTKWMLLYTGGVTLVFLLALIFIIIIPPSSLLRPMGIQTDWTFGLPLPSTPNAIDYRSENTLINTVSLTTEPTQVLSEGSQLVVVAEKNPLDAQIIVRFEGGAGLGSVQDNEVVLTRSDGTTASTKLDFNKKSSEVSLQGTRGTDRIRVTVRMRTGTTYTILDQLIPYRIRG
jgi:hypothetical protein